MKHPYSSYDFFEKFADDASCLEQIFLSKYGYDGRCERCGASGGWTRIRGSRKYLHTCRRQLSPTSETPFFRNNLPLLTIFYAMLLFCNSSSGIRSPFLRKHLGLGTVSAHRLANSIRLHMASQQPPEMVGGPGKIVSIDEVYLKHFSGTGSGLAGKIVLGIECDGKFQCGFISNRKTETLEDVIKKYVRPQSVIMTDQWVGYRRLNTLGYDHKSVNHRSGEFFRENVTTARIDTVWASLRRTFRLYRHMRAKNAWLYLAEATFRYNHRLDLRAAFDELISSWPTVSRYDPSLQRGFFEWA
ncbi:MAG: IS1595 family transposase [Erythrobacter sp.]